MCNPKPLRRSRLLSELDLDDMLLPFFAGRDENIASPVDSSEEMAHGRDVREEAQDKSYIENPVGEEISGDTPTSEDDPGEKHKIGAVDRHTEPTLARRHLPAPRSKRRSRKGHGTKRIRFTGVVGEFLDSASIWEDMASMEIEKAEANCARERVVSETAIDQSRDHEDRCVTGDAISGTKLKEVLSLRSDEGDVRNDGAAEFRKMRPLSHSSRGPEQSEAPAADGAGTSDEDGA